MTGRSASFLTDGGTTKIDAITGIAAINVQSIGETGEVVIQATSPGLEPASLRLSARK